MKNIIKVWLGSTQENDSPVGIPAFYLIQPAESESDSPTRTLLVSLNLPLEQVNQELEIFNGFVILWEAYALESGYEFDYDKELYQYSAEESLHYRRNI